jgi:hypothetical protein
MQGPTIETRACDVCGATAVYSEVRGIGLSDEELCEACAVRQGGERQGEASAGLEAIGFGIAIARRADMTDEQIRRAFELILTDPEEDMDYPRNSLVLNDFKGTAMRTFRPLDEHAGMTAGGEGAGA